MSTAVPSSTSTSLQVCPVLLTIAKHHCSHVCLADLSKTQKVTVTATPSVGHPQVAISAIHHHPDPNNASSFEWSTLRIASGSALVISSDAPNWPGPHVTTFHIGVLGVSPSNFTIVASTSTATLIDGAVTVSVLLIVSHCLLLIIHLATSATT